MRSLSARQLVGRRVACLVVLALAAAFGTVSRASATQLDVQVLTSTPKAGQPVALRVVDPSGAGGAEAKVCLLPRRGPGPCTSIKLAAGQAEAMVSLRPSRPGIWGVEIQHRHVTDVAVQPPGGLLRVLVTGDSLADTPARALARALPGRAEVINEALVGSGITKLGLFDWVSFAVGQGRRDRPDAVFMFVGGNDSFPLRSSSGREVRCCGREWIRLYADRVDQVIDASSRNGRAWVWWLTLPTPRDPRLARRWTRVNTALRLAAAMRPGEVGLINVAAVISPGGKYTDTIQWGGQTLDVRQTDGIHLSDAGAMVAAAMMTDQLRAVGAL